MTTPLPPIEKPKRKIGLRVKISLHYWWAERSLLFRNIVKTIVIVTILETAFIALLIGIGIAISADILQVSTVVSFGVVELFAFILYKLFTEQKPQAHSVMEYMAVADNLHKYAHLVIHYANIGINDPYPNRPWYVINTEWNTAFWVPIYLRELARVGAIETVRHKTEDDLYQFLNTNHVVVNKRYPRNDDLGITATGRMGEEMVK